MLDPTITNRVALVCSSLGASIAVLIFPLLQGCPVCGDWLYGYDVVGTLEEADGTALPDVVVVLTMQDEDGGVVMSDAFGGVVTDETGRFESRIDTLWGTCATGIDVLKPPPPIIDAPLPDSAVLILSFPDRGLEVSVPIAEDMITREPDDPFDDLDLGTVVVR